MFTWQEIVQDYVIRYSNRIQKATRPLLTRFGIEYFTYHRIDEKGNYTVLVDRPDWAENYVSEKFYEHDPYLRDPKVYRPGICLLDHHGSEHYKNTVLETGRSKFHWDLGVVLIEKKKEEEVEFFGFAANRSSSCLDRLYLNQRGILKHFASYFKTELASVLREMDQTGISLPALKGKDFYCKQPIVPSGNRQNSQAFLFDLGLKKDLAYADSLTPAERRCVLHLLEGFSAKETASSLHLSPRTVESYLETLKGKLDCSNKRELFLRVKKLEELGLLSSDRST